MKRAISDFLRQLPKRHKGLEAVILFGSFLKFEIYHDVDVILVFTEIGDVRAARSIARGFRDRFSVDLHIQLFFSCDKGNIEAFLSRAGIWEVLYGQGFASKYSDIFSKPHE